MKSYLGRYVLFFFCFFLVSPFFQISPIQAAPINLVEFHFENAAKRTAITNAATFFSSPYTADTGIAVNVNTSSLTVGSGLTSFSWVQGAGGAGTFSPSFSTSWASGSGSKYWQIQISTENYENLTLSSKQRSSNTGPRDFELQYSTGGVVWTQVSSGSILVADNFTSGVLNSLLLPPVLEDQTIVYLRWIMSSDTAVGGAAVGAGGTSRIDDIVVQGEFIDTTAPVITLNGTGTVIQEALLPYVDLGATWTDNVDGSGSLTASGTVITNILGTYPLYYNYTDAAGNIAAPGIRNVTITSPTCSPGRELATSTGGVVSCEPCQTGRYNPTAGGTCVPATVGYYVPFLESIEQIACPAGMFTDTTGNSSCQSCPSGYSSGTGVSSCILILPTHATSFGSTGGYDHCGSLGDLSGNSRDGKCDAPLSPTHNNQNTLSEDQKDTIIQEVEKDLEQLFEDTAEDTDILESPVQNKKLTFMRKVGEKEILYTLENNYESCSLIDSLNNPSFQGKKDFFPDIGNSGDKDIIEKFTALGVVGGTKDGKFEPTRSISRVEFTKIVLLSHCYTYEMQDTSNLGFADVLKDSWQARVISKAQELGVISGDVDAVGEKIFRPDDIITKGEALKILMRMALIQTQLSGNTSYTDIGETDWVLQYVHTGELLGILTPKAENSLYGPEDSVSREEMIALIYAIIDLYRP